MPRGDNVREDNIRGIMSERWGGHVREGLCPGRRAHPRVTILKTGFRHKSFLRDWRTCKALSIPDKAWRANRSLWPVKTGKARTLYSNCRRRPPPTLTRSMWQAVWLQFADAFEASFFAGRCSNKRWRTTQETSPNGQEWLIRTYLYRTHLALFRYLVYFRQS